MNIARAVPVSSARLFPTHQGNRHRSSFPWFLCPPQFKKGDRVFANTGQALKSGEAYGALAQAPTCLLLLLDA